MYVTCLCLICMAYTVQASSVTYEVDENAHRESGSAVLLEKTTTSRRHCAQLCTADDSCVAANYDAQSRHCHLLALPLGINTASTGSTAMVSFPVKNVQDLMAFWPLNEAHGGRDLVTPGVSDIHLYGVSFGDSVGWRSAPVRYAGSSTSYGQITNSPHLQMRTSFSWMAAYRQQTVQDGPIFNFDVAAGAGAGFGAHIWVKNNKFFFASYFPTCAKIYIQFSSLVVQYQWLILAVAYDHENNELSAWVDGQKETKALAACTEDMDSSDTISVGKRVGANDARYLSGDLTCMSLYSGVKSYDYMYSHTMAVCKN